MFPVFPLAVFKSAKEKKKWLPKKCLVILWLIIFLSFTNFHCRTNIKTALRLRQHTDFIEISSEYIMQKKDSSYRGCFAFIHKPCLKSDKREEIVNLMKVQKEEFYSKLFPILQESFSSLHLLTETNKHPVLLKNPSSLDYFIVTCTVMSKSYLLSKAQIYLKKKLLNSL